MTEIKKTKSYNESDKTTNKDEYSSDLDNLKKEVFENIENSNKRKNRKEKFQMSSVFLTIGLIILVSASLLQAYESKTILEKIQNDDFQLSGNSVPVSLPSNIEDLPNMVGGC